MRFFRNICCLYLSLFSIQLLAADSSAISNGQTIYNLVCATCHEQGFAGAPLTNKKNDWVVRIEKGLPCLYANVIAGLGKMPPRGGCVTCSNQDIQDAINFMLKAYHPTAQASTPKEFSLSELMVLGKTKYDVYCASCHKQNGTGTVLEYPALKKGVLGNSYITIDEPVERHIALILQGISGTQMTPFKHLSDTEIAAIVTYERNAWCNNTNDVIQPYEVNKLRSQLVVTPVVKDQTYSFKEEMTLGKGYYRAYCARCHQLNGEGRAPYGPTLKGSLLATSPELQSYLVRLVLFGAPGTRMRGYRQQLNNNEIATILTYIGNSWGNINEKIIQPSDIDKIATSFNTKKNDSASLTELIQNGRIVYKAYCARCHKLDGSGGAQASVPSLIGSKVIKQGVRSHIDIILTGVPGSIMRAFALRLTDEEIAQVVAYERYKFNHDKTMPQIYEVRQERERLREKINYQLQNQLKQQFLRDEKESGCISPKK